MSSKYYVDNFHPIYTVFPKLDRTTANYAVMHVRLVETEYGEVEVRLSAVKYCETLQESNLVKKYCSYIDEKKQLRIVNLQNNPRMYIVKKHDPRTFQSEIIDVYCNKADAQNKLVEMNKQRLGDDINIHPFFLICDDDFEDDEDEEMFSLQDHVERFYKNDCDVYAVDCNVFKKMGWTMPTTIKLETIDEINSDEDEDEDEEENNQIEGEERDFVHYDTLGQDDEKDYEDTEDSSSDDDADDEENIEPPAKKRRLE